MKKINLLLVLVILCHGAFAQKDDPKKKMTPKQSKVTPTPVGGEPESVAMAQAKQDPGMKAMIDYMTPGKMHEMLSQYDGDWNEDLTFWMSPDAQPTKTTATSSNNMIMEGRYQESHHVAMMNNMPFEGTGLLGYDNAKKVFVSSWIDNMGTGIMHMEGKWDEAGQSIHFKGTSVDPQTGKDVKVREEFKFLDDNHQSMEMFMTKEGGKEYKCMEIKFSR